MWLVVKTLGFTIAGWETYERKSEYDLSSILQRVLHLLYREENTETIQVWQQRVMWQVTTVISLSDNVT
jgi:Ni,Fe-hydrogenase I cytochrome b subunit